MKMIQGNSINELNVKAYDLILGSGKRSTNRNSESLGEIHVEYDVNCILNDPRQRHLNLVGRKSNIFALIGESLWVLAGRDDLEYLTKFIPRAPDFSDDGETWRASYGERMYYKNQLFDLMKVFERDGKYTRRAALSIYDPNKDTYTSLKEKYNLDETRDIPCNQWLNFYIDTDDRLNLKVVQRSGDAIWGAMSINVTEFSLLHEVVLELLKRKFPEIELGTYNHSITNFHLYEGTCSQAYDVLKNKNVQYFEEKSIIPIKVPETFELTKEFFLQMTDMINAGVYDEKLFDIFEIPKEENILLHYFYFSSLYIKMKTLGYRGKNKGVAEIPEKFKEFLKSDNGFATAISDSIFRNFEISEESK